MVKGIAWLLFALLMGILLIALLNVSGRDD